MSFEKNRESTENMKFEKFQPKQVRLINVVLENEPRETGVRAKMTRRKLRAHYASVYLALLSTSSTESKCAQYVKFENSTALHGRPPAPLETGKQTAPRRVVKKEQHQDPTAGNILRLERQYGSNACLNEHIRVIVDGQLKEHDEIRGVPCGQQDAATRQNLV